MASKEFIGGIVIGFVVIAFMFMMYMSNPSDKKRRRQKRDVIIDDYESDSDNNCGSMPTTYADVAKSMSLDKSIEDSHKNWSKAQKGGTAKMDMAKQVSDGTNNQDPPSLWRLLNGPIEIPDRGLIGQTSSEYVPSNRQSYNSALTLSGGLSSSNNEFRRFTGSEDLTNSLKSPFPYGV